MALVTIYFTKKFVGGLLDGISYPTSITFDNCFMAKMAKKYRRGAKGKDCLTGQKWTVQDASFQSYFRPSVHNHVD